jgi:hypothetical protein
VHLFSRGRRERQSRHDTLQAASCQNTCVRIGGWVHQGSLSSIEEELADLDGQDVQVGRGALPGETGPLTDLDL